MSDKNIDKDIEILKSIVKVHNDFLKGCNKETINEKEIQAIENVLSELQIKDKMIDLMAKQINNYDAQLVIYRFRNKEDVIEIFRNEVLKDE